MNTPKRPGDQSAYESLTHAAALLDSVAAKLEALPLSDFAARSVETRAQALKNLATEVRRLAHHVCEDFRRGKQ